MGFTFRKTLVIYSMDSIDRERVTNALPVAPDEIKGPLSSKTVAGQKYVLCAFKDASKAEAAMKAIEAIHGWKWRPFKFFRQDFRASGASGHRA